MNNNKEKNKSKKIISIINNGGVGAISTDTIWGLIADAFNIDSIKKIYRLKKRPLNKSMIILISNFNDLKKLGVKIDKNQISDLRKIWPAKISILFPIKKLKKTQHLNKNGKLAIRMPSDINLLNFIEKTGSIVSTSANISNQPIAKNISEVKKYFNNLDFIFPITKSRSKIPSTLISIDFKKKKINILRKGGDFKKIYQLRKDGFDI